MKRILGGVVAWALCATLAAAPAAAQKKKPVKKRPVATKPLPAPEDEGKAGEPGDAAPPAAAKPADDAKPAAGAKPAAAAKPAKPGAAAKPAAAAEAKPGAGAAAKPATGAEAKPAGDAKPAAGGAAAAPSGEAAGAAVELGTDDDPYTFEDGEPGAPGGSEENPGAPREWAEESTVVSTHATAPRAAYPIELALRPITLASGMGEIALDAPVNVDPFALEAVLRGGYGITSRLQAGLRWGTGTLDENEFHSGKTIAVDVVYRIFPFLGAQLSVPVLLDPFAMGVTIGAPLKLEVTDRLALFFGRDFVSFKLAKFLPRVGSALANEGSVARYDVGETLPLGEITVEGGAIYQLSPQLALTGTFGFVAPDFSAADPVVPLQGTLTWSRSNKLDLGGRLGFADLNDTRHTFGASVFAAIRI